MAKGWSQARKAAQRKAIYSWRPWEKSTGPKSKDGKARVAVNATKHGLYSREMRATLAQYRELLGELHP